MSRNLSTSMLLREDPAVIAALHYAVPVAVHGNTVGLRS
jgi:hypothetical protein